MVRGASDDERVSVGVLRQCGTLNTVEMEWLCWVNRVEVLLWSCVMSPYQLSARLCSSASTVCRIVINSKFRFRSTALRES